MEEPEVKALDGQLRPVVSSPAAFEEAGDLNAVTSGCAAIVISG